ncbi:PDZ domain-containing protein [Actinoplanes octamycinicus]|uniref:endopeptidase La n=1 Tax=Actinoplanes octamycinicus TaxID=135948 RepID=A0A7W7H0D9_9ACTN|nr:S16 family serine protease [Actinoplanes octamycinicus]MBB4741670.1 PDZ domain-containing protein [Actinoplanes octamycinicus]GIE57223.1 Lon protease [Actinoplanes octamycinicus]
MKRRGLLIAVGALITALLGVGAAVLPLPYVLLDPGPTVDTLGSKDGHQVITVTGAEVSASAGQLRLTTVSVETGVTLGEAWDAWSDPQRALVPRDAVFTAGRTDEQVNQENATAFQESESTAVTVALDELGNPAGVQVTVDVAGIGGPSAGLMISLGIVDKLTPADLTGGRILAGTGTVDEAGKVGAIGGIPQKLHGAKAAGATYFLVPAGNCAEAKRNAVPGLPMAKVGTVDEALTALKTITAGGTPAAC